MFFSRHERIGRVKITVYMHQVSSTHTANSLGSQRGEDGRDVEVLRVYAEDPARKGRCCRRSVWFGRGKRHARGLRLHVLRQRWQLPGRGHLHPRGKDFQFFIPSYFFVSSIFMLKRKNFLAIYELFTL